MTHEIKVSPEIAQAILIARTERQLEGIPEDVLIIENPNYMDKGAEGRYEVWVMQRYLGSFWFRENALVAIRRWDDARRKRLL